jgi:hypothetical protein
VIDNTTVMIDTECSKTSKCPFVHKMNGADEALLKFKKELKSKLGIEEVVE